MYYNICTNYNLVLSKKIDKEIFEDTRYYNFTNLELTLFANPH
jgi:hypothetical protein